MKPLNREQSPDFLFSLPPHCCVLFVLPYDSGPWPQVDAALPGLVDTAAALFWGVTDFHAPWSLFSKHRSQRFSSPRLSFHAVISSFDIDVLVVRPWVRLSPSPESFPSKSLSYFEPLVYQGPLLTWAGGFYEDDGFPRLSSPLEFPFPVPLPSMVVGKAFFQLARTDYCLSLRRGS